MSEKYHSETVEIRLAKPSHGERMADMSKRLIEDGLPWWCWTPKRIAQVIRSPDTIAIVAVVGKKLIGFAVMHFDDEHAHLNLLAVEPPFRRRRIGCELLEWLEESCVVAGILNVSLEVRASNLTAIRFYESLGYKKGERIARYYCGKETAQRMTRQLGRELS
ncbi:MAG: ribosomal protein S18 acetylase RimI-like enzyme [Gammaproteobacteria bacterium]|jgi:ribosomal protein S18 acetylase RimI-like enzyme